MGYLFSTNYSWEAGFYKGEGFNGFSYVETTTGPCQFDQTGLLLVIGAERYPDGTRGADSTEVRGLIRHVQLWTKSAVTRTSSPGLMDVIGDYICPHFLAYSN